MKKILVLLVAVSAMCVGQVSAQGMVWRTGTYYSDGKLVVSNPRSVVDVAITIVKEDVQPGKFARYAQKYLAEQVPLVGKTTYSIESADVTLVGKKSDNKGRNNAGRGFKHEKMSPYDILSVDRVSNEVITPEEAARRAADEIFAIRRQRRDLVAGEVGENVFGAGLQSALDELNRREMAYLELFFGKTSIRRSVEHFTVNIERGSDSYFLCRFSMQDGVVAKDDLSGDIVRLAVRNTNFNYAPSMNSDEKLGKQTAKYVVAADVECTVLYNNKAIAAANLPIFQLGRVVAINIPANK